MDNPQEIEKRFIFHGNAVAFGAHIRRPNDHQFKAVASSCLPATGGLAEASSGPQSFQDIISFSSASTSAQGDFADARRAVDFTHGNHNENPLSTQTIVSARITGLKIVGERAQAAPGSASKTITFAVNDLVARLESSSDRRSPVAFRGLEASIQGVTVDGHPLIVSTAPEVCTQHETYDKLVKAYHEDGNFRKQFGGLFYATGHEKTGVGALLSKSSIGDGGRPIVGTVVTGLKWVGQSAFGTQLQGNKLVLEGIGSIYFGEILYEQNSRRLTLLRFQLGSPTGGDGTACDVQSNGQGWPPDA